MLFLLFSLALASGPPFTIDDPTACDATGYLAGTDNGFDCCTFIVCDNARLNKTGFEGHCMGGTAWNNDLVICDDPKYVTGCDVTTCVVPSRTNEPCTDADNTATSCCAGVRFDADGNQLEFGNKPLFTPGASGAQWYVMEDGKGGEWPEAKCPLGWIFKFEDCCCEPDILFVAPCDDTSSFYFENPDDPCCTYLQCWANRTGVDTVPCMPPSVWNDANKTCDIEQKVMACMGEGANCGQEMTDPPCQSPPAEGTCCRAGRGYVEGADNIQYQIVGEDRIQCCPTDMVGVQMEFNFAEDVCCCEVPVV